MHAYDLGSQVSHVLRGHGRLKRDSIGNINPPALQILELLWIVGQQPDRIDTEVGQDTGGDAVIALVGLVTEEGVRVYRVESCILHIVRAGLVEQNGASAFSWAV